MATSVTLEILDLVASHLSHDLEEYQNRVHSNLDQILAG
jgi:hypothetical protein